MKRKLVILAAGLATAAVVAACGTAGKAASSAASSASAASGGAAIDADASASVRGPARPVRPGKEGTKIAVVYLSEPEVADRSAAQGATQSVSQYIQEQVGADLYRIEREQDYPRSHDALTAEAKAEHDSGARPKLKVLPDLSRYDTVFLGYPIWWYDLPMPVYSFLDGEDLSGKTVYIFSTHGGSGLLQTVETIQSLESGAKVSPDAVTISRGSVPGSDQTVKLWLGRIGF